MRKWTFGTGNLLTEFNHISDLISNKDYDKILDWLDDLYNIQGILTFSQYSRTYGFKFYYTLDGQTICDNNFSLKITNRDEVKRKLIVAIMQFILKFEKFPDLTRNYHDYTNIKYEPTQKAKTSSQYYFSLFIESLSI